jgi:hypothetical protein
MSATKPKPATKTSKNARRKPTPERALAKAVRKRLELARDHVYWASGMVASCAYAAAPDLYPQPARQDIGHALEGVRALLEQAGSAVIDVLDDELDESGERGA